MFSQETCGSSALPSPLHIYINVYCIYIHFIFLFRLFFLQIRFGLDALKVMQLMVQAQAAGLEDDDPTRVYMLRAWVHIW